MIREPVKHGCSRELCVFYCCAFLLAWVFWWPMALNRLEVIPLQIPLIVGQTIGAYAPLLSLLVLQKVSGDESILRTVLARIRFKGTPIAWFILPAVLPSCIAMASSLIHYLVYPGSSLLLLRPEPLEALGWGLIFVIPMQFVLSIVGSPVGEEPGWRGYVFDSLSRRGKGLLASAIIAPLWWVWHIPLFIVLEETLDINSFLGLVGYSLLIDSVYLLSGRNLLAAMLSHQGINTALLFFSTHPRTLPGLLVLYTLAIPARFLAARAEKRGT